MCAGERTVCSGQGRVCMTLHTVRLVATFIDKFQDCFKFKVREIWNLEQLRGFISHQTPSDSRLDFSLRERDVAVVCARPL